MELSEHAIDIKSDEGLGFVGSVRKVNLNSITCLRVDGAGDCNGVYQGVVTSPYSKPSFSSTCNIKDSRVVVRRDADPEYSKNTLSPVHIWYDIEDGWCIGRPAYEYSFGIKGKMQNGRRGAPPRRGPPSISKRKLPKVLYYR